MNKENVGRVVKDGLCTSCGVCKSVCAKNAISFKYGKERNTPIVNPETCVRCGLCYDICPGKGTAVKLLSQKYFSNYQDIGHNRICGYYLGSYTAHSNDEEIRFHSSSGGTVTQFILYLLQNKIINGAIVVRFNKNNVLNPEPFIAKTEEEVLSSRGSKYLVVSYDKVLSDLEHFEGKVVVVGLPCQIQGIRMLAKKKKAFSEKIVGYFAIYCSLTKTKLSMDYYLWRYGINRDEIGRFSFRDDGCLGYMKIEDKNGHLMKKIKYEKYWHGTHNFFVNNRCSLCTDHFGELADISFGDIHIEPYLYDIIGISSVITRNEQWDSILKKCYAAGEIELDDIPIDIIIKSQPYSIIRKKGAGVKCYRNIRTILGRAVPDDYTYDNSNITNVKTYIVEIINMIMRSMGKYRLFWPIIRLLDR